MNLTLNIPLTGRSNPGFQPADIARHQQAADALTAKYGAFIDQAARLNNVPDYLLKAILLTENEQGIADSVNYTGATGLGQIKPASGADMIALANTKRLLTADKKAVLRKRLGTSLDRLLTVDNTAVFNSGTWKQILSPALKDAEFNIMVAGLILSMFIQEHTGADGQLRTDYIAARYNQGYYLLSARKITKTLSTDALISRVPAEAKNYILVVCGRNGWLDILT
ncbi:hypothetical protein GCM10027578_22310 [Spirosoma luteolum]